MSNLFINLGASVAILALIGNSLMSVIDVWVIQRMRQPMRVAAVARHRH